MAKKRRKSDKIRAKDRLVATTENKETAANSFKIIKKEVDTNEEKIIALFNYDPKLINQDLKKTLLLTLVVLVVLAFITLRYT